VADPIYIDINQSATLRFQTFTAKFKTVQEAIDHWQRLPYKDSEHVVLVLKSGDIYQPGEIPRLRSHL
jgi:hypothetical protein